MDSTAIWHELWQQPKGARADCLHEILTKTKVAQREINELIRYAWTHTEFPSQNKYAWCNLWPMYKVTRREQDLIDKHFAQPRIIYRGGHRQGLSWTLSLERAQWFATHRHFAGPVELHERLTDRNAVKLMLFGRGEQEVILDYQYWEYDEEI